MVIGNVWKFDPSLRGPIAFDRAGCPDFERPGVGKEIAIAKAEAVREPASRRQRAQLRMEPPAVEYENRLVLGEIHPPLQAIRLVGLEGCRFLFPLQPVGFY